ncbi:MAG: hypothetical protein K8S27_07500 [Candidatus Omnitrophica bacterium]|nr:hypothetical protein [Candidatus Omnitrophota bacterium]
MSNNDLSSKEVKFPHLFHAGFSLNAVSFLLIVVGVVFRLKHYFENRSFWLDEAYVSVQTANRTWHQILSFIPIFSDQPKAPLLVYCFGKAAIGFLGNNEYALRLLPLSASLISLIIFYLLLKKYVSARAQIVALGLFAFADSLIYYAAELKPYSSDVFVFLLLGFVYHLLDRYRYSFLPIVFLLFVGVFSMWLSNPTLFILPGLGVSAYYMNWKEKKHTNLFFLRLIFIFWALNFIAIYKLSYGDMLKSNYIVDLARARGGFPMSYTFIDIILWLKHVFVDTFYHLAGLRVPVVGLLLALVGGYSLFKRNTCFFFFIFSPFCLCFFAAFISKYPFYDRMVLFLSPLIFLLLAEGFDWLLNHCPRAQRIVACLVLFLLFAFPVKTSVAYLFKRRLVQDTRQALEFIKEHIEPDDYIVVNQSGQYHLMYYLNSIGLTRKMTHYEVEGVDDKNHYYLKIVRTNDGLDVREEGAFMFARNEIYQMSNDHFYKTTIIKKDKSDILVITDISVSNITSRRFWIFYSNAQDDAKQYVLDLFDKYGTRKYAKEFYGASVHLYEF